MSDDKPVNMAHGRSEEQKTVMRQILSDGVDPFGWEQLPKYHREPVLKKGTYWLITPNDYPYEGTTLQLLLIYKDRVRHLHEVHPDAFRELQEMLVWIEQEYQLDHGAFLIRFGETSFSGGSVDHLHAHVIVGGKDTSNEKLKASIGYKK